MWYRDYRELTWRQLAADNLGYGGTPESSMKTKEFATYEEAFRWCGDGNIVELLTPPYQKEKR